jgi:hypothetical protein
VVRRFVVDRPSESRLCRAPLSRPPEKERPRGDNVSHQIYTDHEAVDILLTEGHGADDVSEELNALARSGLMLSQPPDMWLLTDEELVLLRLRLCEQGE